MANELLLGNIKPVGANNVVVQGKYVKGGYFVVATTTERDALLTEGQEAIVEGSLCYCQEDDKFYAYNGTYWSQGAYTKSQIDTLLSNKQDTLPTVINDKYLHTNTSTGALEWTDAGSVDFQVLSSLPTPTSSSPKVVFNTSDNNLYILKS